MATQMQPGMHVTMPTQSMHGQVMMPVQGMATSPASADHGKGGLGGVMDVTDGKGQRVSRNSQPKQGSSWHSGERRSGRQSDGGNMRPYGMNDMYLEPMMQQNIEPSGGQFISPGMGPMNSPNMALTKAGNLGSSQSSSGVRGRGSMEAPSSPSQGKARTKIRNPKHPWADVQDNPQGTYDQDMQGLWPVRPSASSAVEHTPPLQPQKQPPERPVPQMPKYSQLGGSSHSSGTGSLPSRGKGGRNDGKGSQEEGKANLRVPSQETQPQHKWVEVRASQDTLYQKGQGKGNKKKSRRQDKTDDWFAQRFKTISPDTQPGDVGGTSSLPNSCSCNGLETSTAASGFDSEDRSTVDVEPTYSEYPSEDIDTRRSGKRKGGKTGKGKGEDKRREKGKGKGKNNRGAVWRSTQS